MELQDLLAQYLYLLHVRVSINKKRGREERKRKREKREKKKKEREKKKNKERKKKRKKEIKKKERKRNILFVEGTTVSELLSSASCESSSRLLLISSAMALADC
jgi:Flp pilus assembly protein TadB